MIHISFIAPDRAALLREIKAYLAHDEAPGASLAQPASKHEARLAFFRSVLERIPPGRVARAILRDWALARLSGDGIARYEDLKARHAEGDGRRWAGYVQSITKVARACGAEFWTYDHVQHGWRVDDELDARILVDLLVVD